MFMYYHIYDKKNSPIPRRGLEMTAADLKLMKSMTRTPISYVANQPPVEIVEGENSHLLGSGLRYQVNPM